MEQFETQLKKMGEMGREVKLTDSERLSMRTRLETGMRISRVTPAKASPYFSTFSFTRLAQAAVFMFIGIIVGGGSIGYISASALPGDALYTVKTDVIEKVKGSFATSPEARLEYQAELMHKRLAEINTLKQEDRLTAKNSASAQIAIARQSDNFNEVLAIVELENSTFAEEKVRTLSDELKRSEDTFTHKGKESGATMMMAVSVDTTVSLSPSEMIADEIKTRREHFEEKRNSFAKKNREKTEYAENTAREMQQSATAKINADASMETAITNPDPEESEQSNETGASAQEDLDLPRIPGL